VHLVISYEATKVVNHMKERLYSLLRNKQNSQEIQTKSAADDLDQEAGAGVAAAGAAAGTDLEPAAVGGGETDFSFFFPCALALA